MVVPTQTELILSTSVKQRLEPRSHLNPLTVKNEEEKKTRYLHTLPNAFMQNVVEVEGLSYWQAW